MVGTCVTLKKTHKFVLHFVMFFGYDTFIIYNKVLACKFMGILIGARELFKDWRKFIKSGMKLLVTKFLRSEQ